MKYFSIFFITLSALLYSSCGKVPENGLLDGQWQLMEICTKSTATDTGYINRLSTKDDLIYWRFQLDLLQIHARNTELTKLSPDAVARFVHQNNQLDITSTYIHFRDSDSLLRDSSTRILECVGITGNAETFNVEKLGHHSMILNNERKRLIFRKF